MLSVNYRQQNSQQGQTDTTDRETGQQWLKRKHRDNEPAQTAAARKEKERRRAPCPVLSSVDKSKGCECRGKKRAREKGREGRQAGRQAGREGGGKEMQTKTLELTKKEADREPLAWREKNVATSG
jgi:hypothetical protein